MSKPTTGQLLRTARAATRCEPTDIARDSGVHISDLVAVERDDDTAHESYRAVVSELRSFYLGEGIEITDEGVTLRDEPLTLEAAA